MNITSHNVNGKSTSWNDKELEAFLRGEWRVDCSHIEVRQRGMEAPTIFSGPGFLYQDNNHRIHVKIYGIKSQNQERVSESYHSTQSGQLMTEKEFFDVVALDKIGREWHSERHLLSECVISVTDTHILDLQLDEAWCEQDLSYIYSDDSKAPSCSLNFTVFDSFSFPTNTNVSTKVEVADKLRSFSNKGLWQFEAAGCDLELHDHENYTEIRISSPFPKCPMDLPDRVLDALFFVLGKPVYPSVALLARGGVVRRTIYSRRAAFPAARHQRPFAHDYPPEALERLMDAYLRFSLIHDNPRFLWAQLNAVYEASAAQFTDAWALTLSVVIESFVNREFESLGQPSEVEKVLVDKALLRIATWKVPKRFESIAERFNNRVAGSLSGIKNARINDRLRAMEKEGLIPKGATTAWTGIRNGTAHSYQGGRISDDKFRKNRALIQVLFYQVFFYAIGYRGAFTDYSVLGWPTKTYPDDNASKSST